MKLFNTLTKKIVAAVAVMAAVAGIAGVAIAGFGPDRPTKAWSPTVSGFDHVVFNSFTGVGNGIGDERDFARGGIIGNQANWADPVNNVPDGAEVEVKLYIHNNADSTLNDSGVGVAKNVVVKVNVPTTSAQAQDITSTITADNASPKSIFDTLSLTGANGGFFELVPVSGSAKIFDVNGNASAISDQLFSGTGVNIGDQKGCFQFRREITFRVKVKMPNYSISKQTKILGQGSWVENVTGSATDTYAWMVTFTNTGNTELKNVKIVDNIPANMTVVPGSVKLTNGNFPNGTVIPDAAIQNNGKQINTDIGNYNPGINAFVTYRTTITDATKLTCGETSFVNEAFATPTGLGAIRDIATAKTVKTNCEVIVVKECKALTVAQINRTTFDFTAEANVSNATVTSYVFTAKDKNGNVIDTKTVTSSATTAAYHFVKDVAGDYKVSVVINTDKGVATGTCEKMVTVKEAPKTPVFTCDGVTVDKIGGRKVSITVSTTADPSNRVQVKGYEYNFGDGSAVLNTDKNPSEYTYAKDGTYNVSVKVTFAVDGVNQTVGGANCSKVVTFTTEVCKFNANLPVDDKNCKPVTVLPKTGGSSTLGLFIATTFVSMLGFRAYASRKQ